MPRPKRQNDRSADAETRGSTDSSTPTSTTSPPTTIGDDESPPVGSPDAAAAATLADLEAGDVDRVVPGAVEDDLETRWRVALRGLLGALNDMLRPTTDAGSIVDDEGRVIWAASEEQIESIVNAGARYAVEKGKEPPRAIGGAMGLAIAVLPWLLPRAIVAWRQAQAREAGMEPAPIDEPVPAGELIVEMEASPRPRPDSE